MGAGQAVAVVGAVGAGAWLLMRGGKDKSILKNAEDAAKNAKDATNSTGTGMIAELFDLDAALDYDWGNDGVVVSPDMRPLLDDYDNFLQGQLSVIMTEVTENFLPLKIKLYDIANTAGTVKDKNNNDIYLYSFADLFRFYEIVKYGDVISTFYSHFNHGDITKIRKDYEAAWSLVDTRLSDGIKKFAEADKNGTLPVIAARARRKFLKDDSLTDEQRKKLDEDAKTAGAISGVRATLAQFNTNLDGEGYSMLQEKAKSGDVTMLSSLNEAYGTCCAFNTVVASFEGCMVNGFKRAEVVGSASRSAQLAPILAALYLQCWLSGSKPMGFLTLSQESYTKKVRYGAFNAYTKTQRFVTGQRRSLVIFDDPMQFGFTKEYLDELVHQMSTNSGDDWLNFVSWIQSQYEHNMTGGELTFVKTAWFKQPKWRNDGSNAKGFEFLFDQAPHLFRTLGRIILYPQNFVEKNNLPQELQAMWTSQNQVAFAVGTPEAPENGIMLTVLLDVADWKRYGRGYNAISAVNSRDYSTFVLTGGK